MTRDTIILAAGKIDFLSLPISSTSSNSMIPVNGKPVIAWICEDLVSKRENGPVYVVCREEDYHLQDFLKRSFQTKLDLHLVTLCDSRNILYSLASGLKAIHQDGFVQVLLGDTLIRDDFAKNRNLLYTHEVNRSSRWCTIEEQENGRLQFHDKENLPGTGFTALCGYYSFVSSNDLKIEIENCLNAGETELSDLLCRYQNNHVFDTKRADQWFDFGNIDRLIRSKQKLLQSRFFNRLTVHPVLNTITKDSDFDEKLRDELAWYQDIPQELQVLAPRIISKEEQNNRLHLVQEYYGYPTLTELYLFAELTTDNWRSIMRKLIEVHNEFSRYEKEAKPESLLEMYWNKTRKRLRTLREENPSWDPILSSEKISFNGKDLVGADRSLEILKPSILALNDISHFKVIHGDLCFSNILFDINNLIVKVIDPRGSFGEKGVYGDPRYDLAKLRHSIHGLYDYIVMDLFHIEGEGTHYEGSIYSPDLPLKLSKTFDDLLIEDGYDPRDVKLIEGLLFISMLPLHQDKPKRQAMMHIRGLQILNEIIAEL